MDESGTIPRATFGPKIKSIAMSLGAPEPKPEDLEGAIAAAVQMEMERSLLMN